MCLEIFSKISHNKFHVSYMLEPSWLGLENMLTASQQRSKRPHANECSGYETKQSNSEVPVLKLWGM